MKKGNIRGAAVTLLAILFTSCGTADTGGRTELSRDQLAAASNERVMPVENRWFLPADGASAAAHRFAGELVIAEHPMSSDPPQILPADVNGKKTQIFPGVSLGFVSDDDHLVPLERDIIIPDNSDSYWQIQVSPGRVWSEEGDGGMSRASFPFLLTSIDRQILKGEDRSAIDPASRAEGGTERAG